MSMGGASVLAEGEWSYTIYSIYSNLIGNKGQNAKYIYILNLLEHIETIKIVQQWIFNFNMHSTYGVGYLYVSVSVSDVNKKAKMQFWGVKPKVRCHLLV